MKGINFGGTTTQFKKGHRPANYKPIGTQRVNSEGYVDIKVADPGIWKAKHKMIWEKANGPIPKGHVLIFGDGNKLNVQLENLILISRKQLATLNKNKLIQNNAELTRMGITLVDVYHKINERKKKMVRSETK
jgi:hypothetical protein